MLSLIELLFRWLASFLRSHRRLRAENVVLRHQVNILSRRAAGRLRLSNVDRLVFVWLYRLCPAVVDAVAIVQPETLIRWHRQGFRAFWRWKSGSRAGRPAVSAEIRELIREMSRAKLLVGRAADPWRAAQARHRDRPVDSRQVHDQASETTGAKLDDLPAQPRGRDCGGRSLRRADDRLQVALWPGHPGPRSAEVDTLCGDGTSDCGVDRATNCRGVSLGSGT
jgi:hypothetical protein